MEGGIRSIFIFTQNFDCYGRIFHYPTYFSCQPVLVMIIFVSGNIAQGK